MTPTTPAFGSENVRSFDEPSSVAEGPCGGPRPRSTAPRRGAGPAGTAISSSRLASFVAGGLGQQLLGRAESSLALRRRRGASRTDSSSRAKTLRRLVSLAFSSWKSRSSSARASRVNRRNGCPVVVELEDPAGHVVEEVAIVGHGHDGAVVVLQETAPARTPNSASRWSSARSRSRRSGMVEVVAAQGDAALLPPPERVRTSASSGGSAARPSRCPCCAEVPLIGGGDPVLELRPARRRWRRSRRRARSSGRSPAL